LVVCVGWRACPPNVVLRSAWGQKLKTSTRAYVFRFAPENGQCLVQSACLKSANKRLMHCTKTGMKFSTEAEMLVCMNLGDLRRLLEGQVAC